MRAILVLKIVNSMFYGSHVSLSDASLNDAEPEMELSLWNWWKEVVFISIFTALMMNLLITQPAINRLRENFRITLERINTRQPVSSLVYIDLIAA